MIKKIAVTIIASILFLPSTLYAQTQCKLIVYCGITMLKPMVEISKEFKKETGCQTQFVKGGSGKLLTLLLKNQNGDLYLPGSDSYVDKMEAEYPGLVTAKSSVGFNQAAIFVKKGNPKGIPADLAALSDSQFKAIIGSAEKGSIGKETKKILTKHGSYDAVKEAATVTLHSQSLLNALKSGKADVSINWYAVSTWDGNEDVVDALKIDETFAQKNKLVLTTLKDSKNPDQAKAFLELASSEKGHEIFKKYGLAE